MEPQEFAPEKYLSAFDLYSVRHERAHTYKLFPIQLHKQLSFNISRPYVVKQEHCMNAKFLIQQELCVKQARVFEPQTSQRNTGHWRAG